MMFVLFALLAILLTTLTLTQDFLEREPALRLELKAAGTVSIILFSLVNLLKLLKELSLWLENYLRSVNKALSRAHKPQLRLMF